MAQADEAEAREAEPAVADAPASARARLVVPVLLAAGWGALFSFMAAMLMDDDLAVAEPDIAPVGIGAQAATFTAPPVVAERPRPHWPDPQRIAALPGEAVPETERQVDRVAVDGTDDPPRPSVAAEVAPAASRADYVGTWGPTASACGAPSRRKGYLPAVLTQDGARAGRTLCRFRNGRREGQGWAVAAECSERGRRWTSQVRLVVDGDRLTWTSAKGASSYIRCGRRDG